MDDQTTSMPAAGRADGLTTACTEFIEPVDAEGTSRSASLAFDRRSWLDLG